MSTFEAFLLGLLQGLTEFFPISSSAHLKIAKFLLNISPSESSVLFDLACHLGTLLALLLFLRRDISALFFENRKKLFLLVLATLPLAPLYFLLKPLREYLSQPYFLGYCLLITALFLRLGGNKTPSLKKENWRDALWIGGAQSLALIPGISRSGSTIACARLLGWEAKEAVRFSFLLSIPAIFGGNLLELLKLYTSHEIPSALSLSNCGVGFLSSFLFGMIAVRFALSYLEKGNLKPFAWYCLILGAILICGGW